MPFPQAARFDLAAVPCYDAQVAHEAPYPCRYGIQRSDARQFARELETAGAPSSFSQATQRAMTLVMERLRTAGFRLEELAAQVHLLSQEAQGLLAFGEWVVGGKRVIDVSPGLSAAFARSDCGDLRIEDALPLEGCAYYHFRLAPSQGVRYGHGCVEFEGAYVLYGPAHSIRIVVCGRRLRPLAVQDQWLERYDLRIPQPLFGLRADQAVEEALNIDLVDIEQAAAHTGAAGVLHARMQRDHQAYHFAVRMVLNALAYRRHVRDAPSANWPAQAPERLVRQALEGSAREKERAVSKLWNLGFVPVQVLGGDFSELADNEGGSTVAAHWRRGHWRNQPHGPRMSLRKLLWIAPMRIHASPAPLDGATSYPEVG